MKKVFVALTGQGLAFLIVLRSGAIAAILASLLISRIHAQTQAAMNAQARAEFEQADAELNKTYQAVLKKLPDAGSKQKLKEAQRAWIASRDAEATRAAGEVRGGSMAPAVRYETMSKLTRERSNQLKNRDEGMVAPSPESQTSPSTNAATEMTAEPSSSDASPDGEDNANKSCDCPPSPDGKFAFLVSDTEENASSERLQILDLIEKKSGKKLQRIDDADMPVFWNVHWAPDSNGLALKTKLVWHPSHQGVEVYFRSGEIFQKIELPNLPDEYTKKEVVWAPDSKRFAVNYSISWFRGYETVAFYQLRDDKWVALRSPVDEASKHSQLAQLARKYSPKNTDRKGDSSLLSNHLEARSWTDANTLLLYAYSEHDEGEAAALFTLKFDKGGNWKIIKMHQMSKKEVEQLEKEQ